ncbi:MAG: HAD family hydrolase [Candidatus Methylomirabilales bacterium]
MIRAALFDLDGTLIDTWDLYIEAYVRTLEPHYGRRLTLPELRALQPTSEWRFLRRALASGDAAAAHAEFLRHYQALHASHCAGAYPGVCEMLGALRDIPLRLGLVTGKGRGAWEITARLIPLGPFEVVVTDEDVEQAKPDPEGLVKALDQLGLLAEEVVYIGDSEGDARAARAAGLRFGAALWPKSPDELDGYLAGVRAVGVWQELPDPASVVAAVRASLSGG